MEKFPSRDNNMDQDISSSKFEELKMKVTTLVGSGAYTARDAIPQVLNGNGFQRPKTEGEKRRRRAYERALKSAFAA